MNIFLTINFNICLKEPVLLSTHNICFGWEIKKSIIKGSNLKYICSAVFRSGEHSQVFLVSPPEVVFSEYKVGQVYEVRPHESIMGVRGGCRRNFLRITAWHYQAVDMENCPALLSWNIWACLRGLRTTKVQNSLRIRPVWSGPLLFTFWKESYLDFLQAKFQFSIWSLQLSRLVWISLSETQRTGFLVTRPI